MSDGPGEPRESAMEYYRSVCASLMRCIEDGGLTSWTPAWQRTKRQSALSSIASSRAVTSPRSVTGPSGPLLLRIACPHGQLHPVSCDETATASGRTSSEER